MGKLTKWIDTFTTQLMRYLRWHIPVLMLLINFDVIMRYVFRAPTIWGGDLATMISAIGRMVGMGYATLLNSHIIMDVFTHNLSFRRAKILGLFNMAFFMFPLFASLIYIAFKRTLVYWVRGERLYTLWKPLLYPVLALLVVCYFFMIIQYISEFIKHIISLKKGSDAWIKDR